MKNNPEHGILHRTSNRPGFFEFGSTFAVAVPVEHGGFNTFILVVRPTLDCFLKCGIP